MNENLKDALTMLINDVIWNLECNNVDFTSFYNEIKQEDKDAYATSIDGDYVIYFKFKETNLLCIGKKNESNAFIIKANEGTFM